MDKYAMPNELFKTRVKTKNICLLIYSNYYNPTIGGVGITIAELGRALLSSMDVEPTVLHRFFSSKHKFCFVFPERKAYLTELSNKNLTKTIDIINKHYDILHLHGVENPFIDYFSYIKVPLVYTCHGIIKHSLKNEKGVPAEYRNGFKDALKFQEQLFLRAQKVIVHTPTNKKILQKLYPQIDSIVIPNGIFLDRVTANDQCEYNLYPFLHEKEHINILFLGRVTYAKGIEGLIEMAVILKKKKMKNFLIVIAGDSLSSNPNYIRLLKNKIPSILHENLLFTDSVDEKWRNKFLQMADVLVHPSLHDSFPNTILEAMAAKVPVVANAVDGINDMIEHEKTGLLVTPGDNRRMAEYVLRIKEDPALRKRLVNNAYRKVTTKYNWDRVVEQHVRLYKELLGRS